MDRDGLIKCIDGFADAQILCVGDVMLDRFIYGSVNRISPEAPIPVIAYNYEEIMLGGAGNVVRNISSLGGAVTFVSVIGNDEVGNQIAALTGKQEQVYPYLLSERKRVSTEKTRYIAGSQQLFRADKESSIPISDSIRQNIIEIFHEELPKHKVVVLSDYGKGVLTADIIQEMINAAGKANIPVIADPKDRDYNVYRGALLLTPNLKELSDAVSRDLNSNDEVMQAAQELMQANNIDHMLVTMGSKGMMLVSSADNKPYYIKARAREVFDVSGAGDTAIATLAIALASGCKLRRAAFLSNTAAGIVVGKVGTAVVYRTDLKAAIHTLDIITGKRKIFPQDISADQVEAWQREGLKIGFTNGCFDIVHAGHIALINDAKTYCDRLVLAINSDASVKRLKGEERPVNSEIDRAMLLAELGVVDMVVIFRDDTPESLLHKLRPDMLMKGADYQKSDIVGAEFVESYGGKIIRIPLKDGYSTTNTIAKIRNNMNNK